MSRDATDWRRRPVRGALVDGFGSTLDLFTTVAEGVIARREGGRTALIHSPDGFTWTDLPPMPGGYRWGGNEGLLLAEGQPLLFSEERQAADVSPLAGWTLDAGGAWTQVLAVPDVWLHGRASEASSVVLTGRTNDRGSDWPWVIVSTDGARTWDRDLSWVGPNRGCLGDIAIANRIVVMVGCEPGRPAIWAAPLAEVALPAG